MAIGISRDPITCVPKNTSEMHMPAVQSMDHVIVVPAIVSKRKHFAICREENGIEKRCGIAKPIVFSQCVSTRELVPFF